MPLPLFPLCALGGVGVADVYGLPWNKNVAVGTPWVGEVDLIHSYHGVPHVAVQEVHAYPHPHLRLPLSPLNW